MKKIDWKEIFMYICVFMIIVIPIIMIIYIEENYELSQYLLIVNILILIITPMYYIIYNIMEKRKTKNAEEKIIIKNIDFKYYRDIIEKYSPATLSFILDGMEFDKDLAASIIYLINKGYLELKQDNKITRTDKDNSGLSKDLKIICNSDVNHLLAYRRLKNKNIKEQQKAYIASQTNRQWMEQVEKEAEEDGLVIERKKYKITSILSILCIIETVYTLTIENYGLFFFSIFLFFLLVFLKMSAYDKNKWVKTQKGYELYSKIVGLKNYIKDFSTLSEKELKEIEIWEDYLIYAIIFNNTSKLNKDALEFYKKICDTTE